MPKGEKTKTKEWKDKASLRLKDQWNKGLKKPTIPRKLKDIKCLVCGKIFRPRHSFNKYCSRKCSGLIQRNRIKKTCIICGKIFYIKLSSAKRRKSLCCSRKCRGKWWSQQLRSKRRIPESFYKKGRRYEYQALKELKREGSQIVSRSAGSKGIFDIWGLKLAPDSVNLRLVQIKAHRGSSTIGRVLPKIERAIFKDRLKKDNFTWANGKMKGIPIWSNSVTFEVWLWIFRKGWKKYYFDFSKDDFILKEVQSKNFISTPIHPVLRGGNSLD